MIATEYYMTRRDGTVLVRTYSTEGYFIIRDGIMYEEAIDPEDAGRVYTESAVPIPPSDITPEAEN